MSLIIKLDINMKSLNSDDDFWFRNLGHEGLEGWI
jgi:hypothetical protein